MPPLSISVAAPLHFRHRSGSTNLRFTHQSLISGEDIEIFAGSMTIVLAPTFSVIFCAASIVLVPASTLIV